MLMSAASFIPHDKAYPPFRRLKHALWFIRTMAEQGSESLERTKSKHVGNTYGLAPEIVKRIKAKHRCELSFSECGK